MEINKACFVIKLLEKKPKKGTHIIGRRDLHNLTAVQLNFPGRQNAEAKALAFITIYIEYR